MPPHDDLDTLTERFDRILVPPPRHHGHEICGAIGLLLLVAMVLVAADVIPLYEWLGDWLGTRVV